MRSRSAQDYWCKKLTTPICDILDTADGVAARRYNQSTTFGAVPDNNDGTNLSSRKQSRTSSPFSPFCDLEKLSYIWIVGKQLSGGGGERFISNTYSRVAVEIVASSTALGETGREKAHEDWVASYPTETLDFLVKRPLRGSMEQRSDENDHIRQERNKKQKGEIAAENAGFDGVGQGALAVTASAASDSVRPWAPILTVWNRL
ncbi:hypothetical protein Z517_09391 [Fonsecaea pedrosoi CBS 271.37]|uniref:Uncharacterized protein n=1 Tax=Fonsecaea pedrosoi CBS 271.37 TaxID=1442368 RepID=A0A0D2ERS5_9EURO|nr:uncharacterized protein Z517_09391 [Fonsecaea pedrosoi CBS 271.37]KIW76947.1 hypothetical protein Z517_09391 [Fonsecaea pedrosoi CBS 271.37]